MNPFNPTSWLETLRVAHTLGTRRLAVLMDPEDTPSGGPWQDLVRRIEASEATDVFVGGSVVTEHVTKRVVTELKRSITQPVVLFPGSPSQVVEGADALLFLSLISGRNPDLLIGRHVEAAPRIARMDLETVPTGYLLIGDPPLTAAAYMSHSLPIPSAKPELAVATAQAGVMLGLQCLYLDAGSGAGQPVPAHTIAAIRDAVDVPLIVGGGMTSQADLERAWQAGATCVVVGSAVERNPAILDELTIAIRTPQQG
jgi:phosphoglycerol geranylgeranyltransferase